MLTVLTWLWAQPGGRATYTAEHVNIWAAMVRRHLRMPHRLACVTDMPDGIARHVDIIAPPGEFTGWEIPTWTGDKPQCLRRVALFAPDAASRFGAERLVSMDLDCVISGGLDPLFSRQEPIVLYKSPSGAAPVARPYNGSMLMLTAGVRPEVYSGLTLQGAIEAGRLYPGSDQAWISYALGPGEATWCEADGVVWWGRWFGDPARVMFFPGHPKPWQLLEQEPFIAAHYRGARKGRALILGYGRTLWTEVNRALRSGRFEAVIASPEAARHWPAPVLAIAGDDLEAERLARMHGFADWVFCGRSRERAA